MPFPSSPFGQSGASRRRAGGLQIQSIDIQARIQPGEPHHGSCSREVYHGLRGLVKIQKTMDNYGKIHHAINGYINYFDWAIFNSYVSHYQRLPVTRKIKENYGDIMGCNINQQVFTSSNPRSENQELSTGPLKQAEIL